MAMDTENISSTLPADRVKTQFESMPYVSMPFAQTQPERMGALAILHGMNPPAVERARVLEIGSAAGGNILPLAARYPDASFTAFDLSPRHVAMGMKRIEAAGLTNAAIFAGDVGDPEVLAGQWDYIICHGLFSWVPPDLRPRIMDLIARHLSPDGVAYVSFNVLPGWRQRQVVRDIMLRSKAEDPAESMAQGRKLLSRLADLSDANTPYGALLRQEAAKIAAATDSYLHGEFFSPHNHPLTFADFRQEASRAGLAYVADTDMHAFKAELSDPALARSVGEWPEGGLDEDLLDMVQGRQFRQALLVHDSHRRRLSARPGKTGLRFLHVSTRLRIHGDSTGAAPIRLRTPEGAGMTTNDSRIAQALDKAGQAFPANVPAAQLIDDTAGADEDRRTRLEDALLQLNASGVVTLSTSPLSSGRATDSRPRAFPYALADLAYGQGWVTNLLHAAVNLDETGQKLLPLLDGERTLEKIAVDFSTPPDPRRVVALLQRVEKAALLTP